MATMPKPSAETKAIFQEAMPRDMRVQTKPMFGQLAGFVNGHMFTGIYGDSVFVRLGDDDRAALLREEGAEVFEPMAGRPMKDYVVMPLSWMEDTARLREWIKLALDATATLPPKAPKPPKQTRPAAK